MSIGIGYRMSVAAMLAVAPVRPAGLTVDYRLSRSRANG